MNKTFRIPGFLWFLIPYFFYKFFVDFYFNDECHGSYYLTSRKDFFIIAIFFGLLIIFNSKLTNKQSVILKGYINILIIVAPIVTIIQVFNPFFLQIDYFSATESTISIYSQRRPSLFGFEDPNALGFTYIPLALTFINTRILENKKKLLLFYLVCIIIVLVFSNARYLMFGIILVFLQLIMNSKNKLKAFSYFLIYFAICVCIFYFVYNLIGFNLIDLYNDRLHDVGSTNARLASFHAFIKLFPHYLFWGIGNQVAPPILHELKGASPFIHIGFLNHLIVYGVIGSSFLFAFWLGLLKWLYKRAKTTHYWAGLFAFLFFLWANVSLVMYSIFFSGLLLSFISAKYYTNKILQKRANRIDSFTKNVPLAC